MVSGLVGGANIMNILFQLIVLIIEMMLPIKYQDYGNLLKEQKEDHLKDTCFMIMIRIEHSILII